MFFLIIIVGVSLSYVFNNYIMYNTYIGQDKSYPYNIENFTELGFPPVWANPPEPLQWKQQNLSSEMTENQLVKK